MKLHGKRMLAMIMSFVMLLSVASTSVFAETLEEKDYDIEVTLEYTGYSDDDKLDLLELVEEEIEYEFESARIDNEDIEIDLDADLYYGSIGRKASNYGIYTLDLNRTDIAELNNKGYLYEEDIYYEVEDSRDYVVYSGYIEITIATYENDLVYDLDGDTEFELGEYLVDDLLELTDDDLNYLEFELDEDNDCGDLYIYDSYEEEWIDFDEKYEYYYLADDYDFDLEDLIFEHDGSEGEFIIYYTAYDRYDDEILEGVITINCTGALYLEAAISNDETYTFDSEDFQDAVDDWDDAYTLVYIDNVELADSSDGDLYYDYDEDSNRNEYVDDSDEYYVDDDDYLIDYITFVPDEDLKDTVTIYFDAYVKKNSRTTPVSGVLKIEVEQAADITIKAEPDEEVEIDYDLFQEYLEDDLDSRNYDVAYVVISDAPRSKDAGYLMVDDETLTTRGDKTFYMDADKNEYSLEELYYQGGEKKGTYSATFIVYYYKTNSASRATASSEGTIDFVVEDGSGSGSGKEYTISNKTPLLASQVMTLSATENLTAFRNLGENNNTYITFTSLPVGGKLYYKYGTNAQADVMLGTAYYIDYTPISKQLSDITFVPSYSTTNINRTISFNVKAYNAKNKSVNGVVDIAVAPVSRSTYFKDVVTGTYAASVDFLYNRGIAKGMTIDTFEPNGKVTRGQFVTFLYRAAGEPAVSNSIAFTDVKSADYYYDAIRWAVANGVTNGRSATSFAPDADVTYQEIMQFLYNYDVKYLKHTAVRGNSGYVYDYSKVDSWAQTAVTWAVGKGIFPSGTLYPTTAGTRANVALYLHRMLTL